MSTDQSRTTKGQPTGGQFQGKTYTEADASLIGGQLAAAADERYDAEQREQLLRGKYIAATVLAKYPGAAYLELSESDQQGTTWFFDSLHAEDGTVIEDLDDELNDALTVELWALPGEVPMARATDDDGNEVWGDNPDFDWLQIRSRTRWSTEARIDIQKAAAIEIEE